MHEINTAHPFSAQSLLDKSRSDFLPVGWEASDTIRCADAVGIKAKYDGNIFAMIAAAFAEACEVKSALLRLMADQQKALLGMTRELTGYANDLQREWSSLPDDKPWKWKEDGEKSSMMTKIIAAAKRSGVLISGKKVDEWLKGKDEMTKPDLMLFKEMLTDKAQEKSDANNQVLTQIQQGFQGYVNATKGQTNIHTLASDIAGRIIDAIR